MKTELLTLTPEAFCAATCAREEFTHFALQHATMADVWDAINRPNLLMWLMRELDLPSDDKQFRLFACWCIRNTPISDGRTVWDLLKDERSRSAVETAERFVNGNATKSELARAWDAAWNAAYDAAKASFDAARAAAREAAWDAARSAAYAAWPDAWAAAYDAACDAACAAAYDAAKYAECDAAKAAWDAARAAANAAQAEQFRKMFPNPFTQTQP